ncbi:lanthionine synthetase LanC family protein [Actinomadura sp. GTD37]|uniref:lanthionine synthetase LanC family protein n=1 Tax=Actinomadura sp. GTD37 TaxID=1778030 RepID=UPI0035BF99E2
MARRAGRGLTVEETGMTLSGPLVLPGDVALTPVERLPPDLRSRFEHGPGDHCVTRPGTRVPSRVVDPGTASLLALFRQPATIVDAVIAYSSAAGLEPRRTLDDAFPVLAGFIRDGLLLPAGSPLARPVASSLRTGDAVGGAEVVEPVQVLVDTEVYRVRLPDGTPAALKITEAGSASGPRREETVLRALDGRHNPGLLAAGDHGGRPFLLLSWVAGVDVHHAAAEARGLPANAAPLDLAERVVAAFAHLHAQDVLHGDVHPRNVLVGPDQRVVLLDFGLAAGPGAPPPARRGGVDFFLEPEAADAPAHARPVTARGEQYSVAALVYLVLTGAHTHAFSLHPEDMLRQLRDEPPLPFAAHSAPRLPAVERVLRRALAKDPAARYASLATLLRSFRAAAASDRAAGPDARRAPGPARRLLDDVLARLSVSGPLLDGGLAAPTASLMNGGAGFGYALSRMAQCRDDERLLALADVWTARAVSASGGGDAFVSEDLGMVPEVIGENSLYHHGAGVHCVQALVAQAACDEGARETAIDAFLREAAAPCPELDVAFGRSGLLLGCATLLEECGDSPRAAGLRAAGDRLRDSVWSDIAETPVAADARRRVLGAAHGWTGYLFALLRWARASASEPPGGAAGRLDELGALAHPAGRGLLWPFEADGPRPSSVMGASWCNGAAGQVHLWWLAHALLGEPRYERWARGAAWGAYEGPGAAPGDLCCGLAGRSYALLDHHAVTGEPVWLARARVLADRAAVSVAAESQRADSLYKGEIGTALLLCELETPDPGRMPLYAPETRP